VEGEREGERPFQNPGLLQAGAGLPLHHGRGEAGPDRAEDDARSEALEWERREREEERRQEAEGLGAERGGERPHFLLTPSIEGRQGRRLGALVPWHLDFKLKFASWSSRFSSR
jgi:hypothetical protein